MGPVEKAIRQNVTQGDVLHTPDKAKAAPFQIEGLDNECIVFLIGRKKTRTPIPWGCLEGIPNFLRGKDWIPIGTVYDTHIDAGTLDGYLKQYIKRATAGWVAVVLGKAGLIEIDRTRPMHVRLIEEQS